MKGPLGSRLTQGVTSVLDWGSTFYGVTEIRRQVSSPYTLNTVRKLVVPPRKWEYLDSPLFYVPKNPVQISSRTEGGVPIRSFHTVWMDGIDDGLTQGNGHCGFFFLLERRSLQSPPRWFRVLTWTPLVEKGGGDVWSVHLRSFMFSRRDDP